MLARGIGNGTAVVDEGIAVFLAYAIGNGSSARGRDDINILDADVELGATAALKAAVRGTG